MDLNSENLNEHESKLRNEVQMATTAGTIASVGAIVSGLALASVAPVAGIAGSAIGATMGVYFLWRKWGR